MSDSASGSPQNGKNLREWGLFGIAIVGICMSLFQSADASSKASGASENRLEMLERRMDRMEIDVRDINKDISKINTAITEIHGFSRTTAQNVDRMWKWIDSSNKGQASKDIGE